MQERISKATLFKLFPVLPETLSKLGEGIDAVAVDPALLHLIEIRASQINGCGFCQHMHLEQARKRGEHQERLDVLSAWREALTELGAAPVSEELFRKMKANFNDEQVLAITAQIVKINAWNRVVAALQFIPNRRSN